MNPGPVKRGGAIGTRITMALVSVALITLLLVVAVFYGFLGGYVIRERQDQLLKHAQQVSGQIEQVAQLVPELSRVGPMTIRSLAMLLRSDSGVLPAGAGIYLVQGNAILAAGPGGRAGGAETEALSTAVLAEASRLAEDGASASTLSHDGSRTVVAVAPTTLGDNEAFVMVTLPASDAVSGRRGLVRMLLIAGIIAVGVSIAAGLFLGSRLAEPLKRLARSARKMAGGAYDEPISGDYAGEVFELAAGLETMRREVQRSEASLRGFVASAAHELRTPLTSIQGFSQALLDGTAATSEQQQRSAAAIYRESGRLQRMVDALLVLSRFDSREFRPNLAEVDAVRLVSEEVDGLAEAGLIDRGQVMLDDSGRARLVTDPDMLRQIVANLLRNAAQYGGRDEIEVQIGLAGSDLALTISNGGPPIPEEERGRIFERFYRGRNSHSNQGFGLGLPLVKEIAEVLGGRVELLNGPRTSFRVQVPSQGSGGTKPGEGTG